MSALGRFFLRMKKKGGGGYEGKERKEKAGGRRKLTLDIYTAAFNSWIALHGNPPQ